MTPDNRRGLSVVFPCLIWVLFLSAVLAGLAGTLLPSLDFFPAGGHDRLSLSPWKNLFASPGIKMSIKATLVSGSLAACTAIILTILFVSLFYKKRTWYLFEKILAPMLSIPHAAFAVGLLFLVSPSGWIIRMLSPAITGFTVPPDWVLVNDANGICLAAGLVVKEFPFLVMVTMGALVRVDAASTLATGRSMGYSPPQVWLKVIIPRLYPHLRLSVYAITAYSLSVVDMAMILGPTSPPVFSVYILKWFNDPGISNKLVAAAGSLLLLAIVAAGICVARGMEMILNCISRRRVINRRRTTRVSLLNAPVLIGVYCIMGTMAAASVILVIWSFSLQWQFPSLLPVSWTTRFWNSGISAACHPVVTTVTTGVFATLFSLALAIGCLEHEVLSSRHKRLLLPAALLYIPLLLPQVSFMAGVQLMLVFSNLDGFWISLVWSHVLFVLPYIFLTLGATYRDFDHRITRQAIVLGKSYYKSLFKVKLPMLLRPILISAAIGFSVSVSLYIPTMIVGSGRFFTVTTEVVTLATGSDRRAMAVFALIQQMLPLVVYALAILVPKALYYNKKGMQT